MKTIGIVGSRRRDADVDYLLVSRAFGGVYGKGDRIVSGGCRKGGDRFAELIADRFNIPITIHRPDQGELDLALLVQNPRAAYAKINYARNTLVARDADVLIACVAPDRRGGTEDTIRKFEKIHPGQKAILV